MVPFEEKPLRPSRAFHFSIFATFKKTKRVHHDPSNASLRATELPTCEQREPHHTVLALSFTFRTTLGASAADSSWGACFADTISSPRFTLVRSFSDRPLARFRKRRQAHENRSASSCYFFSFLKSFGTY
jgi:hypothetical protein